MLKDKPFKNILALAHIGSLLKGAVHNMNSPLSSVLGRAEMLQIRLNKLKELNSNPDLKDAVARCINDAEIIINNCTSVNALTSNLMQKSISCSTADKELLDLSKLFQDEILFMNANMEFKHNFSKEINIEENIYLKDASYVDFSNTFNEIIDNSMKALKNNAEKEIGVSLTSAGDQITIKFSDNGPGIDADLLNNIRSVLNTGESDNPSGFSKIAGMLAPYKAEFEITSSPGGTHIIIKIPGSTEHQREPIS